MSTLTTSQRDKLPASDFVFPETRSYPIHDIAHARNALARCAQYCTPEERAKVKAKVYARYPELRKNVNNQKVPRY